MTLSLFVLFTLNAPLHIIQGSTENLDSFVSFHIPKWSAVRQRRFGFGIIEVVNSTHLIYQQKDEKVLNGQWMRSEFDFFFSFSEQNYRHGDDHSESSWTFWQLETAVFVYFLFVRQ